jgi:epoxyqueuosine reductase
VDGAQALDGSHAAQIVARALELGFDAVGFARADEPLDADHVRYEAFVADGLHGEMGYLADHRDVRRHLDGEGILPGARTVVCLARRYDRAGDDRDAPMARRIARYARGRDYHNHLKKRLVRLASFVRDLAPGTDARALCDTAPVLERAWAARAGLGFVGKNGLLIIPGKGSYCLLGEVVTTLTLGGEAMGKPMADRCGSCRACLDACPTDAFAAPYVLDPRRCISYLTIESRALDRGAEVDFGDHLFGCDDCQEACPYNRVPSPASDGSPFAPLPIWGQTRLEDLVASPPDLAGSPVKRAQRRGLARNALRVAVSRLRRGDDDDARRALAAGLAHPDPDLAALARRLAQPLGAVIALPPNP